MPADHAPPALICLAGPTASGKSAVALALAELAPVEIISVDSALVYRGMDIGTAKPTAAERAAVSHHLIDIRDPAQAYSAAEFARDAPPLIHAIRARGRLPVLVGGTMLYFKALLEGLSDMPAANPVVRQQLEARAAREGWPALHAELARIDPVTAARLAPADSQRIQRALEVWQLTGQPLSALQQSKKIAQNPFQSSANTLFSLEPVDRAWLHARIAQRFDAMLADGLVDEVAALRARGDLSPDLPSMRSVGYRQVWETLDGLHPQASLRERGVAATRQLAKRQLTWLRSMPQRQVLPVDDKTCPRALARQLQQQASLVNF
ncbi:MAG: tRNA (adenosine(37)-N6)-dimethylallyltransferase MiaA [Pseudomonadota bacterium]|nr:tRNA (adenosine(37)-N6)-dimethylallyltransferase MiaA [Pseudomonadota bacterium]